jgi:hypothetical protein
VFTLLAKVADQWIGQSGSLLNMLMDVFSPWENTIFRYCNTNDRKKILIFFPTMQNKYIGILQKKLFLFHLQRYKINILVFSKKYCICVLPKKYQK